MAVQILKAIESGQSPLGSKLPSDRDLAELMGVSRPTVREAVLALEVVGVLQVRSGDGTYVTHDGTRSSAIATMLNNSTFQIPSDEVLEARMLIEPIAVALAASRITPEAVDELELMLDRADDLAESADQRGEYVGIGLQFHAELLRHCHNAPLAAFVAALVDLDEHPLWTLLNVQAVDSIEARRQQVAEHREILRAVRAGEAERATALMRQHLDALGHQIRALSPAQGDPAT